MWVLPQKLVHLTPGRLQGLWLGLMPHVGVPAPGGRFSAFLVSYDKEDSLGKL